jgi:hypothetical protein
MHGKMTVILPFKKCILMETPIMFKFYVSLAVSIVVCVAYHIIASNNKVRKEDDEVTKRQLILFLTMFVITYCALTLVYEGGLNKSKANPVGGNGEYPNGAQFAQLDELLENVDLGEPPF